MTSFTDRNPDLLFINLENAGVTIRHFQDILNYPVPNALLIQQNIDHNNFFIFHRNNPVFAGSDGGLSPKESQTWQKHLAKLNVHYPVILNGLGLGDHVDVLLTKMHAKVIVLEKNPACIKMAFQRFNWQHYLKSNRVVICDPLRFFCEANNFEEYQLLNHPLTGKCYHDVAKQLQSGVAQSSIDLLLDGKLLVDDWFAALCEEGRPAYIYPPNLYQINKINDDFNLANIQKIWSINRISGLENLAESNRIPYSIYEIDPDLSQIPTVSAAMNQTMVFSYREANAETYRKQGWNAVYMPLATNSRRFKVPYDKKYHSTLSFVGASMLSNALKLKKQLLNQCNEGQKKTIETFWQDQAEDPESFRLAAYTDTLSGQFATFTVNTAQGPLHLIKCLAEWSGACHRIAMVRSAARFGIDVWGDADWKNIADQTPGMNYRGKAGHLTEVPRIYASSYINLDVTRIYQPEVATLRLFDVFAAGSLAITNIDDEQNCLYPEPKLITFSNSTGLQSRIDHVLSWPESQYRDYVHAMREHTLREHTFERRVQQMLQYRRKYMNPEDSSG